MTLDGLIAVRGHAGTLPGQVWRPGDALKHLGPPPHLQIHVWSKLFQTRCGLPGGFDSRWQLCKDDDDVWCPDCLKQGGIPHTLEEI